MTKRGISWCEGWAVPLIQNDFSADPYYHSGSHRPGTWPRGIPVLRMIESFAPVTWVDMLPQLVSDGYTGKIIMGNEPDIWNQDNCTPQSYLNQYQSVCSYLAKHSSNCTLIVGNVIRSRWLRDFINIGGHLRSVDEWGIHIYQVDNVWRTPTAWIDTCLSIIPGDELHITEYGLENHWEPWKLRGYIREIERHPGVLSAYAYFGSGDNYANDKFDLYEDDRSGNLTKAGLALQATR